MIEVKALPDQEDCRSANTFHRPMLSRTQMPYKEDRVPELTVAELIRNWIATVVALAALLVATRTFFLNTKVKRELQPRLVYAVMSRVEHLPAGESIAAFAEDHKHNAINRIEFDDSQYLIKPAIRSVIKINNQGSEVIGPVHVIQEFSRDEAWPDSPGLAVSAVPPKSAVEVQLFGPTLPGIPATPTLTPVITFRDSGGNWWKRKGSAPIKRIRRDKRIEVNNVEASIDGKFLLVGQGYIYTPSKSQTREADQFFDEMGDRDETN